MKVTFRTDASLQIGIGHAMRCLTLADALSAQGAQCTFLCRAHPGNLIDFIQSKGYPVQVLPKARAQSGEVGALAHAHLLGCSQAQDAAHCKDWLKSERPDWLVVDHYALDACWEAALRPYVGRLMVIDDLADRSHLCDLLLDQNMVANMNERYVGKVPQSCACLLGPQFALLRPEFNALRASSLSRRVFPELKRLLVFMGGGNVENDTGKVIDAIKLSKRNWQYVDVVVGQGYPALPTLKKSLETLAAATLHVQTSHMARLMAAADLALTGGGSVTWEKCALGLPGFVVIQGANQHPIATLLHASGAQRTLGLAAELTPALYAKHLDEVQPREIAAMSKAASAVCDGTGVVCVMRTMGIPA